MHNTIKPISVVVLLLLSLFISAAHMSFDHYNFSDNGIAQFLGEDCSDCTFSHSPAAVDTSSHFFPAETYADDLKHPDYTSFVVSLIKSYRVRAPPVLI